MHIWFRVDKTTVRSGCFPLRMCVFVYFSACTSTCLSGACVGCQFWLLSLQIHDVACKLQILRELTDSKATYTDNNNRRNHHAHHGPAMPGLINQLIHKRAIVNTESLNHKHILCWLSSIVRNITQKLLYEYHVYV